MFLKKRALLLGVAVAAFGAVMASSAFANPSGRAETGGSAPVSVQPIAGLSAKLSPLRDSIPANGRPQKVASLFAGESDPDYDIEALSASITSQGGADGTCGDWSFGLETRTPSGDLAPDGENNVEIGVLLLKLAANGTNNDCVISGAVVEVIFQAI